MRIQNIREVKAKLSQIVNDLPQANWFTVPLLRSRAAEPTFDLETSKSFEITEVGGHEGSAVYGSDGSDLAIDIRWGQPLGRETGALFCMPAGSSTVVRHNRKAGPDSLEQICLDRLPALALRQVNATVQKLVPHRSWYGDDLFKCSHLLHQRSVRPRPDWF